jgi:predicted DNA binding CopG/RHH family protein
MKRVKKMKTKKKKPDVFDVVLDEEEREINEAINKGELKSVVNLAEEVAFAKAAATNYLRKNERVNIRISGHDLARLKQKAAYKGLPYQTFIASVLHEYAAGHFGE